MNIEKELFDSVENNNIHNVKLILNHKDFYIPKNFDNCLRIVIEYGYLDIFKLLLSDDRIDPNSSFISLFYLAVKFDQFDIVKLLLKDKRVDPSHDNNYIIRFAYNEGYLDIVNLLWQDQSCLLYTSPSPRDQEASRMPSSA